ncbi:MAG: nucleoside phosphorylase [Propionibacteriaceae bacterium]|nr:nucleoside phosphorylase [Propionibacteriaceae bacterium]
MITHSYDPYTPEIISPRDMVKPIPGFPDTMLVTFQPRTFAVFLDQYDTTPLASLDLEEAPLSDSPGIMGRAYSFSHSGRVLGAALSPIGAPAAVALVETAIAYGTTTFVVFGTCGALVPEIESGGLIVPTSAYRDEGTSYHYAPASDEIAIPSAAKTAAILDALSVPHTLGKVWTTDAFFRETQATTAKRVREGCVAVDMEASALAAVARFRQVAIHQFLYAADALTDQTWDPRLLGTLPAEPRARYLRIAAELAVRL